MEGRGGGRGGDVKRGCGDFWLKGSRLFIDDDDDDVEDAESDDGGRGGG